MRFYLAIAMIVLSLAVLEAARSGVEITRFDVGQTPVTRYARTDANGPVVVLAHGFAGSQQMMQGYALPLARAGYRVHALEFLGHGRHRVPMSGDVSSVDGTTRLLVTQISDVIDAVAEPDRPVALAGHSMATDILVRVAAAQENVGPVVLISAFSQEIDAVEPADLLLITGAWETGLRRFALRAVQMIDPVASEGDLVTANGVTRQAVVAPFAEHVAVLHSRLGRRATVVWLDNAYGRQAEIAILPTGWAILGLFAGLVLVFRRISGFLPECRTTGPALTRKQIALVLLVPVGLAPIIAVLLKPSFLPVLVADYLVLHLLVYGLVQLTLLRVWRGQLGPFSWVALAVLLVWCAVFGFALNRYAANFWPTAERFWIVAIMLAGALPFMVADSVLTTHQGLVTRLATRAAFLASLGLAVTLDFEGLFFLLLIAPVFVLFFLVFGTIGREASTRAGPLASGIALGVVLAWALGVSFPLFAA